MRKSFRRYFQYLKFVLLLVCLPVFALAAQNQGSENFTFTFENDAFVGEDSGYTNGMGITFSQAPFDTFNAHNLPGWLHGLTRKSYISKMKNKHRGVAHMFFQRMQTPERLEISTLIENDVPYAGLLAWQGTLYAWDVNLSDQLSLYLGAVGPVTLAEQAQITIHELIDADDPKGWRHQIGNEPVFKVEAQRVWNLYRSKSRGFQYDILGLGGVGLGNLESATKWGLAVRWGTQLESSFSVFSIQADRQVNPMALTGSEGFYLFFGVHAGWVFNDILIDGNTFRSSHSVPLDHIQDQISAGAVWSEGRYGLVFQISSISSKTTLINKRGNFGALSYTYQY